MASYYLNSSILPVSNVVLRQADLKQRKPCLCDDVSQCKAVFLLRIE